MMKKILDTALMIACVTLVIWFFVSWADVVSDNTSPNPTHAEWNLFEVGMEDTSKFNVERLENWCGSPAGVIRMIGAYYYTDDQLIDEDGNVWKCGDGWSDAAMYLLWIDDNGTTMVEDDEVLKVWQEV